MQAVVDTRHSGVGAPAGLVLVRYEHEDRWHLTRWQPGGAGVETPPCGKAPTSPPAFAPWRWSDLPPLDQWCRCCLARTAAGELAALGTVRP